MIKLNQFNWFGTIANDSEKNDSIIILTNIILQISNIVISSTSGHNVDAILENVKLELFDFFLNHWF